MIPNPSLCLLSEYRHDPRIRSTVALVIDKKESIPRLVQRVDTRLALPRYAITAKRSAGTLKQMSLTRLLVAERKQADQGL